METGETHQHCWLRIWNLEPRAPGLGAWVGGPTAGAQGPKERTPRGADDPAERPRRAGTRKTTTSSWTLHVKAKRCHSSHSLLRLFTEVKKQI